MRLSNITPTFVIPTRDEQDTIGALVKSLATMGPVVVSDDSDDSTSLFAASEGATVVDALPGLGPAYLEAWKKIGHFEYVVHVDAGESHPISSIRNVALAGHPRRGADIVIGSRFMPGGSHAGSATRNYTSRVAATAMNLVTPYRFTDWTSGLRRYSPRVREYLASLDYETVGHAWQIESLYRAAEHGFVIDEVPITYHPSGSSLNRKRVIEAFKLWWDIAWS